MTAQNSTEAMATGLRAALSDKDWQSAHRHIERLKSIVLDGVVRDDPLAIHSAGLALQSCGQHLELGNRLPMETDALALAWQLRADAATAVLAQRIRPIAPLAFEIEEDVANLLLRTLRECNYPMSNAQLAERAGKDPATISRTLKRLKALGKIKQWRSGRRVYNSARSSLRILATDNENSYRLNTAFAAKSAPPYEPRNPAPGEELKTNVGLRNPDKDAVAHQLSEVAA